MHHCLEGLRLLRQLGEGILPSLVHVLVDLVVKLVVLVGVDEAVAEVLCIFSALQ